MDGQEWAFRGLPAGARRLRGPHCSVGYPNSILAGEGEPKWLLLPAHLSELPGEIDALLEHVAVYLWVLDLYLVFVHGSAPTATATLIQVTHYPTFLQYPQCPRM